MDKPVHAKALLSALFSQGLMWEKLLVDRDGTSRNIQLVISREATRKINKHPQFFFF
jgi:hypothetical protein